MKLPTALMFAAQCGKRFTSKAKMIAHEIRCTKCALKYAGR